MPQAQQGWSGPIGAHDGMGVGGSSPQGQAPQMPSSQYYPSAQQGAGAAGDPSWQYQNGMPFVPGLGQQGPQAPTNMQDLMQQMGYVMMQTNMQLGQLAALQSGHEDHGEGGRGYRSLKPKKEMTRVTAESARVLMTELMDFEVDLNELGVSTQTENAYRQLRSMATGKALDVINLETVQGQGKILVEQLQAGVSQKMPRQARGRI